MNINISTAKHNGVRFNVLLGATVYTPELTILFQDFYQALMLHFKGNIEKKSSKILIKYLQQRCLRGEVICVKQAVRLQSLERSKHKKREKLINLTQIGQRTV